MSSNSIQPTPVESAQIQLKPQGKITNKTTVFLFEANHTKASLDLPLENCIELFNSSTQMSDHSGYIDSRDFSKSTIPLLCNGFNLSVWEEDVKIGEVNLITQSGEKMDFTNANLPILGNGVDAATFVKNLQEARNSKGDRPFKILLISTLLVAMTLFATRSHWKPYITG